MTLTNLQLSETHSTFQISVTFYINLIKFKYYSYYNYDNIIKLIPIYIYSIFASYYRRLEHNHDIYLHGNSLKKLHPMAFRNKLSILTLFFPFHFPIFHLELFLFSHLLNHFLPYFINFPRFLLFNTNYPKILLKLIVSLCIFLQLDFQFQFWKFLAGNFNE